MNAKDLAVLQAWLRSGATLREVEQAERIGLVDNERFSVHARRAYVLLWTWSAVRFAGRAGAKQDDVNEKCGAQFLQRRIERAQRIAARLAA